MKTYNQFLETPFSEEVKPPEPPSEEEDPSIKSKEKRQMQIKKMVLLKKLQAVRAGAGADIVAGYEPEGEMVEEEKDAYKYVVSKLKAKYGSGVMTKGDKMPEPSAAQKKKNAAIRAKRAKEDHRDPTEKASDGRYSDRYSNRGSD